MKTVVKIADYHDPKDAAALIMLMDYYSRDPMGGGKPLEEYSKLHLVEALSRIPHAFTIIAYANDQAVGLINCFEAFSTFACKPLINIHDVVVLKEFRGEGVSRKMLEKVEDIAKERGCCKLTLEVLEGNIFAQAAYRNFGFDDYKLDPEMGRALFWQKELRDEASQR